MSTPPNNTYIGSPSSASLHISDVIEHRIKTSNDVNATSSDRGSSLPLPSSTSIHNLSPLMVATNGMNGKLDNDMIELKEEHKGSQRDEMRKELLTIFDKRRGQCIHVIDCIQ